MPWRETADPYRILVSEVMLQQTRAATVIPYYQRWLDRFPDVYALAGAHVDDVLKQWEGLGYYSRARNLQRAAQMVRENHDGCLPRGYAALHDLPGVGAYTAAAVASIAFNAPHAAVDGNVKRVLSRIFDRPAPRGAELQAAADRLLDPARPGDFNQAMMELGATVCTPRHPACAACPVRSSCGAYRNHTTHLRPAARMNAPLPEETVLTLVACSRGDVLVVQRPAGRLLGGLWEFPEIARPARHAYAGQVTHTFTHKRITYRVFTSTKRVRVHARERSLPVWCPLSELDRLAFSSAQRKVWKLALPFFG